MKTKLNYEKYYQDLLNFQMIQGNLNEPELVLPLAA